MTKYLKDKENKSVYLHLQVNVHVSLTVTYDPVLKRKRKQISLPSSTGNCTGVSDCNL